jgi:drug/metabolite transporter superfamily protein YnfA
VLSAHLYVVYAICSVFGACCLVLGLKQSKNVVLLLVRSNSLINVLILKITNMTGSIKRYGNAENVFWSKGAPKLTGLTPTVKNL